MTTRRTRSWRRTRSRPAKVGGDGVEEDKGEEEEEEETSHQTMTRPLPPRGPDGSSYVVHMKTDEAGVRVLATLSATELSHLGVDDPLEFQVLPAADRVAALTLPARALWHTCRGILNLSRSRPASVSRSSTIKHPRSDKEAQRSLVHGCVARRGPNSTRDPFFPNYQIQGQSFQLAFLNLGTTPAALVSLARSHPWDNMRRDRVRGFVLQNPKLLSQPQLRYMTEYLQCMYAYREYIWWRLHSPCLSTPTEDRALSPAWAAIYNARVDMERRLSAALQAIGTRRPPSLSSLLAFEPAFWRVPHHQCQWVTRTVSFISLDKQLALLDWEEPIRSCWSKYPKRFVEAIMPEHFALVYSHKAECWPLPTPWNRATFDPALASGETLPTLLELIQLHTKDQSTKAPKHKFPGATKAPKHKLSGSAPGTQAKRTKTSIKSKGKGKGMGIQI